MVHTIGYGLKKYKLGLTVKAWELLLREVGGGPDVPTSAVRMSPVLSAGSRAGPAAACACTPPAAGPHAAAPSRSRCALCEASSNFGDIGFWLHPVYLRPFLKIFHNMCFFVLE